MTEKVAVSRRRKSNNPFYPPPQAKIQAGHGGAIETPTENDVLSGRGGGVNGHIGNKQYRTLVNSRKEEYLSPKTRKLQKTHIAANIVWSVRQSNGRFLKLDKDTGSWFEIGDKAAFRKTGQALRENAPGYRVCYTPMLAAQGEEHGGMSSDEGSDEGSTTQVREDEECLKKSASEEGSKRDFSDYV